MLGIRTLVFTLLLPGTATVAIPYWIVAFGPSNFDVPGSDLGPLGVVLICLGAGVIVRGIWDLAQTGRGTVSPVDPPQRLVMRGIYTHVRNPIAMGVLIVLLGEALLFESLILLGYSGLMLLATHLVIVCYEEPTLREKFGRKYEGYCQVVRRWWPRLRAAEWEKRTR